MGVFGIVGNTHFKLSQPRIAVHIMYIEAA